jgi:hypothetical protein
VRFDNGDELSRKFRLRHFPSPKHGAGYFERHPLMGKERKPSSAAGFEREGPSPFKGAVRSTPHRRPGT